MSDIKVVKRKMDIGTEKDMENANAKAAQYESFMEYIAICDHPEILEEDQINE